MKMKEGCCLAFWHESLDGVHKVSLLGHAAVTTITMAQLRKFGRNLQDITLDYEIWLALDWLPK